jgi:hypothetical protein
MSRPEGAAAQLPFHPMGAWMMMTMVVVVVVVERRRWRSRREEEEGTGRFVSLLTKLEVLFAPRSICQAHAHLQC